MIKIVSVLFIFEMLSDDDFVDALRLTEGVSLDGWELFINFKENKVRGSER